ncbi:MAG: hypothetical protein CME31_24850 [Gimesia sp.]|uniref:Uncharacterized protein n=1 Tax=Gimesia maris TaxID=122 RepID=A0A3D3RDA3_9PLAN|nr:hypothetical protein [Gimesia sp.]HCO26789.1 hypothetical protein [Gimesia maris]
MTSFSEPHAVTTWRTGRESVSEKHIYGIVDRQSYFEVRFPDLISFCGNYSQSGPEKNKFLCSRQNQCSEKIHSSV